ncbi:MAG TPA: DUF2786 domain-containing protein [Egibacteraceae bacterium]|nr:DUF2786 domain-containing protein [Egibacteraceae bacterium]
MGKQNKQRRAAKKRRQRHGRAAGPTRPPGAGGEPRQHPPPPPSLVDVLWAAAWSADSDAHAHEALLAELAARGQPAVTAVHGCLREAVAALWQRGWTPADVVRVTARRLGVGHADTVAGLVVADGRRHGELGQQLHPRWSEQLAVLEDCARRSDAVASGAGGLRVAVAVLGLLSRLPGLPPTVPAPGQPWGGANGALGQTRGLDERMLARVRSLLAKAESTEFDEEAEALTAKAQELIARHAIDEALLHTGDDVGEPSARRIPVEDPYADAKASLLTQIAGANRCRVVYSPDCGWVTAFGYDHDLDAVELLAASLLAQATSAMARLGSHRDAAGRSRTRSFRRAFLLGFAHRISQRLRDATDGQVAGSADADRLLPVLAARDDRLRAAQRAAFPEVVQQARTVSNAGGWVAGQAAADLARLDVTAGAIHTPPVG